MKYLPKFFFSVSVCFCSIFILAILGCSQEPQKAGESLQSEVSQPSAKTGVAAKTGILATISDQHRPTGFDLSSQGKKVFQIVFSEQGGGVAYLAEISGQYHVVYNGIMGRPITGLDKIIMSADGSRIAYGADFDGKWRMVIDNRLGVISEEVGDPVFSPDNQHIAYAAKIGKKWHMIVDDKMSSECRAIDGKPVFSGDSTKLAYVEKIDDRGQLRLIVSDLALRAVDKKESSGAQLVENTDKTRIAAVRKSGKKQSVIEFSFDSPKAVNESPQYDEVSRLVFGPDGESLAYVAGRGGQRVLVLNGKEEAIPKGDISAPPVVRPDGKGIGVIMASEGKFFLYQAFSNKDTKEGQYDEADGLAYGKDGLHAYAARKGNNWVVVANGKEGPALDRVVSPVFSPDGKFLLYRARKDGKRFVVVADANGKTLRQYPAYEQVFQTVFTADGKSVAYGVKDGNKLIWKVEKLDK